MSGTIINLIIQLIAGAIGGNAVGAAAKNVNLGQLPSPYFLSGRSRFGR
jgi:hypothetical protein